MRAAEMDEKRAQTEKELGLARDAEQPFYEHGFYGNILEKTQQQRPSTIITAIVCTRHHTHILLQRSRGYL